MKKIKKKKITIVEKTINKGGREFTVKDLSDEENYLFKQRYELIGQTYMCMLSDYHPMIITTIFNDCYEISRMALSHLLFKAGNKQGGGFGGGAGKKGMGTFKIPHLVGSVGSNKIFGRGIVADTPQWKYTRRRKIS